MPILIIKTKPEFEDDRGFITRLINDDEYPLKSVLYIKSKAGSIRANHYHKKDAHYAYCLSGKFRYVEKDLEAPDESAESAILNPGDMVLSHPMKVHAMEFLEDTVFLAFTTESRDQNKYEEDTVRVKLV